MLINLSNTGKKAIIDSKHYGRVKKYTWFLKRVDRYSKYVATSVWHNGHTETIYLHRFILQASKGMDVHHRDENIFNNQEENLLEEKSKIHRAWHNKRRSK